MTDPDSLPSQGLKCKAVCDLRPHTNCGEDLTDVRISTRSELDLATQSNHFIPVYNPKPVDSTTIGGSITSGTELNPMGKLPPSGRFHLFKEDKDLQKHSHMKSSGHATMDCDLLEEKFGKLNVTDIYQNIPTSDGYIERFPSPSYSSPSNIYPAATADENIQLSTPASLYAERLLANESELRHINNDGDTILHLAIIHYAKELILRLVKEKVDISFYNIQNKLQQSPLHLAIITGQVDVARILVVRGVATSLRDSKGNTALHLACLSGDINLVTAITRHVVATNTQYIGLKRTPAMEPVDATVYNYNGDTCLHLAAAGGHVSILRYLLTSRILADVNIGDGRSGRTILHHAVETRNTLVLLFLLQNRTMICLNVHALTYSGHSAVDLAASRRSHDLIQLLEFVGATHCLSSDIESLSDSDSDTEMLNGD